MKTIFAILPFAVLAIAKPLCSRRTVTETVIDRVTVTVPAPTLSPIVLETSTTPLATTVYVMPTPKPYYPFRNGTNYSVLYSASFPVNSELASSISAAASSGSAAAASSTAAQVLFPIDSTLLRSLDASSTATIFPIPSNLLSSLSEASPTATPSSSGGSASISFSESTATPVPTTSPFINSEAANTGEATFYGGNVSGGMCSFESYTIPSGIFGTALSDANWNGAGNCGACVSVTGPQGNSIKAMVVDQCPGCGSNHLDLFPDAFAKLAEPSKGVIPISWTVVPCGITSPIILKSKSGTSPYWFSMQVMNSNVPVSKLEVSTDGGSTWKATTRQPYNFFEQSSGFGTQTVDVKVTSVDGGSIVVKGVSVAPNSQKTATANFP